MTRPPIIPPGAGQVQPDLKPAKQSAPTPGTDQPYSAGEKRALEPTRADFGEWDWDFIVEAFYPVMAQVHDIHHHRMAETDWTPWAKRGETPELIAECREILAQLEAPIKAARRQIATLEGTARLRAHRRIKNGPDLTGHCIIIETFDAATAHEVGRPDDAGRLAIVECHDGRRGKVCAVQCDLPDDVGIEDAARGIARTYGARYSGVVR